MIECMDIEGIRRQRAVYRSPRLEVTVRSVQVTSLAGPRPYVRQERTVTFTQPAAEPVAKAVISPKVPMEAEPKEAADDEQKPTEAVVATKRRRLPSFAYAAAVLVLAAGGALAYQAFMTNKAVEKQITKLQTATDTVVASGNATTSLPSDTKPSDPNYLQNYKVAPSLPQLLTIKKIGVTARILQVGVDKDNRMDVPKTAYDTAWYNGSSRPGENGAMVIDGHVQGVGGGAIFSNLHTLVAGDTIGVQRGDGKQFTYTVSKVETIPVKDVDTGKLLVSADTSRPGLNMITCGGTYDQKNDQFESRTIVYAVQQ